MDGQRFDELTRTLATRRSRRGVLAGLTGALAAGLIPTGRAAGAACSPEQIYRQRMGCVCKTTGRPPNGDGYCPCPSGQTRCRVPSGWTCVDTSRDTSHCGGCGVSCDDGNACTKNVCQAGVCRYPALTCDDGLACTTNGCDPAVGCVYTPDHAACDDGVACTVDTCAPDNPGRDARGCIHLPDAGRCDKGIACVSHACDPVGGCLDILNDDVCPTPTNPCLKAVCTDTGCQEVDNLGALCLVEGDRCVLAGVCASGGVCQSTEVVDCSSLGSQCVEAYCDPGDGTCQTRTGSRDGQGCAEGDPCLTGKTCQGGVCQGGTPKSCASLDGPCSVGVCNETSGVCVRQAMNVGDACDDGLVCRDNTLCQPDGTCGGGEAVTCFDPPECNRNPGRCEEPFPFFSGGCRYTPLDEGWPCGDGGSCDGFGNCIPCRPAGTCVTNATRCCSGSCTTDPSGPFQDCCDCD